MRMGSRRRAAISDINVTPIVDVMLMLLVIFILTAPAIHYGLEVGLPKGSFDKRHTQQSVIVTLAGDGQLSVQERRVSADELGAVLVENVTKTPDARVMVAADESVPYGHVMTLLSDIRSAGIEDVYLLTEPIDAPAK